MHSLRAGAPGARRSANGRSGLRPAHGRAKKYGCWMRSGNAAYLRLCCFWRRAIRSVSTRWQRCSNARDGAPCGVPHGRRCKRSRCHSGAMKMTLYRRRCIATGLEKRLRSRPRCKFYWAIQWANSAHPMPRRIAPLSASLLPFGGQNLVEACALGTPVIIGPHTFNFEQSSKDAMDAGAALCVADTAALASAVRALLTDAPRCAAMSTAALAFAAQHRGATARAMKALKLLQYSSEHLI